MADNKLPPGFRFCPTDEELVVHFLRRKDGLLAFHPDVIPDLDVYPYNPWELQGKALSEESKWYYYSRRMHNHRVTDSGYWKPMGMDEPIISSCSRKIVGMKKFYMFYIGEPPADVWTSWIMHEYRLPDSGSTSKSGSNSRKRGHPKLDYSKCVICKVFERRSDDDDDGDDDDTDLSCLDEVFLSLDDLEETSLPNEV